MQTFEKFISGFEEAVEDTKPFGNPEIDVDAVSLDIMEATEELVETSIMTEVAIAAVENIEASAELDAEAIAKGKFDAVAAQESYHVLESNLKVLGIEPSKLLTPGFEADGENVPEEKKNVAAKLWEGIKNAAIKVWEAVVKFVKKVVDFIAGLFGKREADGQKLLDMLEKLEKEGKTILPKDAKFDDKTVQQLAENNWVVELIGGSLDAKGIEKYLKSLEGWFSGVTVSYAKALKQIENTVKEDPKNIDELKKVLKEIDAIAETGLNSIKPAYELATNFVKERYAKDMKDSEVTVVVTEIRANKIRGNIIFAKKGEFKTPLEKLTSISVKSFTIDENKAAIENAKKHLKPLTFDEAKAVAEELKNAGETVGRVLEKFQKEAKRFKETVAKELKNKKEASIITRLVVKLFVNKVAKDAVTAVASSGADLVKSRIAMIVRESAKLYVKEEEKSGEKSEEGKAE